MKIQSQFKYKEYLLEVFIFKVLFNIYVIYTVVQISVNYCN